MSCWRAKSGLVEVFVSQVRQFLRETHRRYLGQSEEAQLPLQTDVCPRVRMMKSPSLTAPRGTAACTSRPPRGEVLPDLG